jgi:polyhydroxyalkanoate synthase subunit PhaC
MNQPANSAEQSNGSPWQFLDQQIQTLNAKLFSGLSPISLAMAQMDWALNLLQTPSAQMQLQTDAAKNWGQWMMKALQLKPEEEPTAPAHSDARFAHSTWQNQPWASLVEAQHLHEQWWHQATQLRGMRPHSKEQMGFYASKWLDMMSPSNWLGTNPEAMEKAMHSGGLSLAKGAQHALEDWWREHGHQANNHQPTSLQAGQGLAMTPGQVVARSHLCELIQYAPTTSKVHAEPVLIIPSCIMKYYILDLSPHNSMVKWLVSQGHTVYMVSWRNPDENDALLTMDDYVQEGVLASLTHVQQAHREQVHLMGYCLGGTFAAIAAAKLEGEGHEDPHGLASLTLLAAETDFSEPGEMGVLIDEAQVRMLEDMMAHQGFLSGKQMAGSFQFLHSRDLVWSNRTKRWLLGDEDVPNDLMIWNADLTRLPAVMHSQYLRQCFLHNDLANGHFSLNGDTLVLHDIELPIFAVGTVKDHVSPWRSVYKLHHLVSGPVTFALTNGGHNAGIISEPGHHGRHYQLHTTQAHEPSLTSEEWLTQAETHEGSWWTTWSEWLLAHGSGRMVAARKPPQDKELGAAPGQYVMVRYAD